MIKLTIDADTLNQFSQAKERVEVCDPSGRVVGYFTPSSSSLYTNVTVPFTEKELDRFEQEPGGRPLKEIIDDIEGRS